MNNTELEQLLNKFRNQETETEYLEFKEAKNSYDFKKLGKYFSALSNEANLKSQNSAWLIFGVKDKPVPRPIVGTLFRNSKASLDSLKAEIANKTNGRITFTEIYDLLLPQGRVIMFQIPPAPKGIPVSWEGHFYGRDGEDIGPLNSIEYDTIRNQANNEDWSAKTIPDATIDDLDPKAIAKAREEYKEKFPRKKDECDSWDDITFLNKAKVTIKGVITNTAILLLGKDESTHYLNPSVAQISWILKNEDNIERDYEHFGPPFILNSPVLFSKIRNLTYRYMADNSLFPTEIKTYDSYVIREALHNSLAHQDYTLNGRVTVVEKPDELIFSNLGSFIPGTVNSVIEQDAPQEYYRNPFLAHSMVNLNMIDTIGSGIKRMFITQRNRFFPLPDYKLSVPNKVEVRILGRVWNENYTKSLMSRSDLELSTVILLDRVQKSLSLENNEIDTLRKLKLIEGRKPNLYVSANIAEATGDKSTYIRNKAFDDDYYKKLIVSYLKKYKSGVKSDFSKLILDKLSSSLTATQKTNKVKNLIQSLKNESVIELGADKKTWLLSK